MINNEIMSPEPPYKDDSSPILFEVWLILQVYETYEGHYINKAHYFFTYTYILF
jgi:hypothetical protein